MSTVPEADPDSEAEKLSEVTQEVWSGCSRCTAADCERSNVTRLKDNDATKGSVKGCRVAANIMKSNLDVLDDMIHVLSSTWKV